MQAMVGGKVTDRASSTLSEAVVRMRQVPWGPEGAGRNIPVALQTKPQGTGLSQSLLFPKTAHYPF